MFKVLITEPIAEEGVKLLRQKACVDFKALLSPHELASIIGQYDALVVRSRTKVTEEVIEAGQRLKVIARAGAGLDNVDVKAAERRGIAVINAGESVAVAVAELTLGLMLSLARRIPQAHFSLKEGRWEKQAFLGTQLQGKILGIVGLGRIGRALAKRAMALEMIVIATDPFISPEKALQLGVNLVPLEKLLQISDFVSIHVPLTHQTSKMIGWRELCLMKPTAYLINTARGGIVDEEALARALEEGRIAGAAVDVFEEEPPVDSPLLRSDRVILTPHIGASTQEAQALASLEVARKVLEILSHCELSGKG
jgi:D-3-phosphoglycerate dehydrogenase